MFSKGTAAPIQSQLETLDSFGTPRPASAKAAFPRSRNLVLLFVAFALGCTSLPQDRPIFGQNATWLPGGSRLREALVDSLAHPWTWVPVAGAGVVILLDADDDIADWAHDENPVFGSPERALAKSSQWKGTLMDASLIGVLAADSGKKRTEWVERKALGFLAIGASDYLRGELSEGIKVGMGRERPDASDSRSFPSGHTSGAFHAATWLNTSLDYTDLPDEVRVGVKWASLLGAAGVGWARIEAGRHYPTDVLVGAALGNASALFFQRAFLGVPEPGEPELRMQVAPNGFVIGLHWTF